jgi:acetyltransferase
MEVARDRDLEVMEGQVLSDNKKMLELMASLNFKISIHPDDNSIKHVVAQLHK